MLAHTFPQGQRPPRSIAVNQAPPRSEHPALGIGSIPGAETRHAGHAAASHTYHQPALEPSCLGPPEGPHSVLDWPHPTDGFPWLDPLPCPTGPLPRWQLGKDLVVRKTPNMMDAPPVSYPCPSWWINPEIPCTSSGRLAIPKPTAQSTTTAP